MLGLIQRLSLRSKRVILTLMDMCVVPAAVLLAAALLETGDPAFTAFVDKVPVMPWTMAAIGIGTIYLGLADMRLLDYVSHGLSRTILLAIVTAGTAQTASWALGQPMDMRETVAFGLVLLSCLIVGRLTLLGLVTEAWRRGRSLEPVLIYGAGSTGGRLAQALSRDQEVVPVAFVDDNASLHGMRVAGLPVYPPTEIGTLAARHGTERIVIAMPSLDRPRRMSLTRSLERRGFEVQTLPSFGQLVGAGSIADTLKPASTESLLGRPGLGADLDCGCGAYEGRSVLVSGAGGSIGLELCRQILACKPRRLVLYELSEFNLFEALGALEPMARDAGCTLVPRLGTITDALGVRRALRENDVEVVLHAAAFKHVHLVEANAVAGVFNNVIGTRVMAQAAVKQGCERFVLVSSDKAVRPSGLMGASKRMAEIVVQDIARRQKPGGTVLSMVRFGNVLESSGSVMPRFREQIRHGGPVTVTHPDMMRYFMSIDEAARLVLMAGSLAEGGEVFVLDMGDPRRIIDVACEMIRSQGYVPRLPGEVAGDIDIEITGLRPGEKLREELLIGPADRATQHPKIFRARESVPPAKEISAMSAALREATRLGDEVAVREIAARWVEGFQAAPRVPAPIATGAGDGGASSPNAASGKGRGMIERGLPA